ncbi:uncharacterized protein LOC121055128 [Oryza brachyantha]|uniref:uncharacterized protein LOC121055128 n=1 Tax=Oryza brachyantha TaxID=4533 RepID=UPI001ADCB9FD|nr:uncharacterized protein LOC121055128 [Oryza brachyantha]
MYNPEQQPHHVVAPPRMSFSSDFALEPPPRSSSSSGTAASVGDADFEFSSVGSRPMMAADQLFSKGRILPMREAAAPGGAGGRPLTLRDELRAHEAANGDRRRRSVRPAAATGARWKEMLGLKRAHRKPQGAIDGAEEGASPHDLDHMDVGGGE